MVTTGIGVKHKTEFVGRLPDLLRMQRFGSAQDTAPADLWQEDPNPALTISKNNLPPAWKKKAEVFDFRISRKGQTFEIKYRNNVLIPSIEITESKRDKIALRFNNLDSSIVVIRRALLEDGYNTDPNQKSGRPAFTISKNKKDDHLYLFLLRGSKVIFLGNISVDSDTKDLRFSLHKALEVNLNDTTGLDSSGAK